MILKEFNYYLKKGTTLEEIQGSLIKKVNRWCDPFTGCVAHVFDTVLLKHWIVASDNVVGLYKLDKNILLFNDFQMIYDRLDKIEKALPKDDVKEDIIDRLDKIEENLSNIQSDINDKKDELSHQEKLKEQLKQEISTLDKKIEEAKARGEDTTELEKQKEEKEKELANVTKNITNITNEITKLEQTINNLLGQKDSIEKELEEHKPKEMAEKEYVDKRDNYILGQIESLIPKDPNRDSKKEEIKNTDNSIVSKEEELDNKEKEIGSQKELAKNLADEIAKLKDEIRRAKERGEDTTALEKELASKEQQLANTNSNISNLEKEKDKIKKELANLKGLKEELEKELDSIKPPEMVTIATNQTITGSKTFSKTTTFNETIRSKGANTFSGANTFTENTTFNKGQVTFNNKAPICSVTPTAANHLTTKDYVDRINTNLTQIINTKDSANVKLTGNQIIAGNKTLSGITTFNGGITSKGANTFSGNNTFNTGQVTFNNKTPICSVAPTVANHLVNKAYVDGINTTLTEAINTKDAQNVKITGNQIVAGNKTFNGTTTLNGAMISKGANTFSGNNTFNTGQVTFNNNAPISNTAPTNSNHLTTKNYVDNSTGADKVIFMNIADNSNEAEALKGKISTKQVFDEWLRYGTHYASAFEGIGEVNSPKALEEIKSFTYDSTNDYILSNINSVSWIYFLNPTPVDNFTLEIDCTGPEQGSSIWWDDDFFFINLASIVENGEHFRLDVRRKLQNSSSSLAAWEIIYVWGKKHTNNGIATTHTYVILINKNSYVQDTTREPYRPNGWHEGVWKLKAKRTGKKFEAWTSFMNQTYDNNTYITWTLPDTKPENIPDKPWEMLQRMCNSKALMGIGNWSQNGKFKIVNQTNVIDMKIYDLSTNTILTKNPTTGVWSSSVMGNNVFPNNTLISSKLNNKLYYCTNGTLKLLISGAGGSGLNGTWKNMTAQRQLNVVYTNDTANPIMVCVSAGDAVGGTTMECFVDDLEVIKNRSIEYSYRYGRVSNAFIVPSGSTYKVTGYMGGYLWTELGR
ncbi:hypothetical protein [Campylobacter devanensis]|uniref:hypothetical protein n=1 Tax=Campylobacter devanensis TaxID=3161138 RepID=UPI000A32FFF5|nr:hypothetical protein [Campylobacter sp. P0107]